MFPKVSAFLLVLSVVAAAASVAAAVGENVSMMLFLNVAAAATGDVVTVVAGFVSSTCEGIFFLLSFVRDHKNITMTTKHGQEQNR